MRSGFTVGFLSSAKTGMRRMPITLALAVFAFAATPALHAQQPMGGGHHDMPKPTNLKVLPKDISSDDLIKIMHGFNQQLGVHCNFCHAEGAAGGHPDFASDAKPEKSTARSMMQMTHEINEKYLSQIQDPDAKPEQKTVTCGTCHRGESMPSAFTPAEHPAAPGQ